MDDDEDLVIVLGSPSRRPESIISRQSSFLADDINGDARSSSSAGRIRMQSNDSEYGGTGADWMNGSRGGEFIGSLPTFLSAPGKHADHTDTVDRADVVDRMSLVGEVADEEREDDRRGGKDEDRSGSIIDRVVVHSHPSPLPSFVLDQASPPSESACFTVPPIRRPLLPPSSTTTSSSSKIRNRHTFGHSLVRPASA